MADNLEILKQNLDTAIDPNAGPGQILAQAHNDYVTEFINKQGKYVGIPMFVKNNYNGISQIGDLQIQSSLNDTNLNEWILNRYNSDGNDLILLFNTLAVDDLIHLKDFVGRSCYFYYKSHIIDVDNNLNDIIRISVEADSNNINYTYQTSDVFICLLEFFKQNFNFNPSNYDLVDFQNNDTNNFVRINDITVLAKQGLIIKNYQNITQFTTPDELQFKGVSFDSINKRISVDPLGAFNVYVNKITGSYLTGELNNENKPFAELNSAITAVRTQKGTLNNYEFIITDNSTYEIIQPVIDLEYLHINSLSNTPTVIQRTSFALSKAFILLGFGLTYKIIPNSNTTSLWSSQTSMIALLGTKNVYFNFGRLEFDQQSPPITVQRGIRFYSNTVFNNYNVLSSKYAGNFINGFWVNDGYTSELTAFQGDCENSFFPNSTNKGSKNVLKSFVNNTSSNIDVISNCLLEISNVVCPAGSVTIDFSNSCFLKNANLQNTHFRGQAFNRNDNGNFLSGRATVTWNKNYVHLFNPLNNDVKFSGIPINKIETNILKDLHLIVNSNNALRCQNALIRYLDTDYPTQLLILDNTVIEFDQTNKAIFLAGGSSNVFGIGGAAGWSRTPNDNCYVFRNSNKFFGGNYLFEWSGTLDYTTNKYLSIENGSITHEGGLGISLSPNLKLHNINNLNYIY